MSAEPADEIDEVAEVDEVGESEHSMVRIVLISPYELGRQPFGLAEPARWLDDAGFDVRCCDLSIDRLSADALAGAGMVAIYLPMHTATRIAFEVLPRVRALAPRAVLCAYGLYAPVNARGLRRLGVDTVIGGEYEPHLLDLAERVRAGAPNPALGVVSDLAKITFRTPLRDALPALDRYAAIVMPDGASRPTGFTEASRGCKHLCRHCPVVPVYEGRFRIVPVDVVIADIAQQVAAGARHISFGDPDFLNGPTHALRVARAVHETFPEVTWDATVKIEHIVRYPGHIEALAEAGCLFLISAVESIDDRILEHLAKGHTAEDFEQAVEIVRAAGLHITPTFVPFTPMDHRRRLPRPAHAARRTASGRERACGPALNPAAGAGWLAPVRDRQVRGLRRRVRRRHARLAVAPPGPDSGRATDARPGHRRNRRGHRGAAPPHLRTHLAVRPRGAR